MSLFLLLVYVACAYTRPMDFFPELAPYRIMLWLGALCGAAAVAGFLFREQRPSFRTPQILLMLALVAAVVLSRVTQGWLGGGVVALADFGTTAAVFFLIVLVVTSIGRLQAVAFVLVASVVFLAGQALFAYHFGYDAERFVLRQSAGSDDEVIPGPAPDDDDADGDVQTADSGDRSMLLRVRSVGFLADPNDFSEALLMVLPMLGLAWQGGRVLWNLAVVVLPSAILLYTIYLTHSRGALIGLVILLFLAARQRWGTKRAIVAAVMSAALGLILQFGGGRSFAMQEESNAGRLEAWSQGLGMFRAQPLLGVGYGLFAEHHDVTAHNSFVLCFAELGLIGYFLWLALLFMTGFQLRAFLSGPGGTETDQSLRRWANAIQMSFYSFLGTALFLSRTYNVGLYVLLAFTVVLVEVARHAGRPVQGPAFLPWVTRVGVLELASIAAVYALVRVFNASR